MTKRSPTGLADPTAAAIAWARFRQLMRWMMLVALVAVVAALLYLWPEDGDFPIHMMIATIAGVFFTVMLGAALMLLVFMSAGSGHDDEAAGGAEDGE